MYIDLNRFGEPSFYDKIENDTYSITYQNENGLTKTKKFVNGYDFLSFYYKLKAKKIRIFSYKIFGANTLGEPLFIEYTGYILILNTKIKL
jgi:hypothetical protein